MENELFDLVLQAQSGDKDAMQEIISMFLPAIRRAKHTLKSDRRDDLEQYLIEKIIRKIHDYDVERSPDFTAFCKNLVELHSNTSSKP